MLSRVGVHHTYIHELSTLLTYVEWPSAIPRFTPDGGYHAICDVPRSNGSDKHRHH